MQDSIAKEKSGVKKCLEICAIKGGVGRLMANAILNFHFDYLKPSLTFRGVLNVLLAAPCAQLRMDIVVQMWVHTVLEGTFQEGTVNFIIKFLRLLDKSKLCREEDLYQLQKRIVRRSPPRHSPPQTFTTSDVHHPLCKIRRSPPQTFTTSDVHHPLCKIRRSPPQTFTTPDIHHPLF